MSTTLRPIIGTAEQPLTAEKKFFLVHWSESIKAEFERDAAASEQEI
jgi:hypothetical protein